MCVCVGVCVGAGVGVGVGVSVGVGGVGGLDIGVVACDVVARVVVYS